VPVLAVFRNGGIPVVQFGLLPQAHGTGVRCFLADRYTDALAVVVPFDVVRAFAVALGLAVDQHGVWFHSPVCRQHNGAVARTRAGLDSFGEIDFAVHLATLS
jgi:hypothetical protein